MWGKTRRKKKEGEENEKHNNDMSLEHFKKIEDTTRKEKKKR